MYHTVLGPFLFSLTVNDIKSADGDNNLLVKFADDITVSAPVKNGKDTALTEVTNIKDWANENRIKRGKKIYEDVNIILFFRKSRLRDSSEVM